MKYLKLYLLCSLLVQTFSTMAQTISSSNVNALADLYIDRYFNSFPEKSTLLGIVKANNADLSDNSIAGVKKWQAFQDSLLRRLKSVNQTKLSKQDAIAYGILREKLEGDVGCRVCKNELWSVSQMRGWQVTFSELAGIQPVGSEVNRNNTLQRWGQIARYIVNEIDNFKEGLKLNYTAPKQNVKLVIEQLNDILKQPVVNSYFYAPAQKDSTPSFTKALQLIIEQQIYPQVLACKEFLTNDYLGKARQEISIAAVPNGAACYKALLRSFTTLSTRPEEVYKEGIKAVAKREDRIKEIGSNLYGSRDLKNIKEYMRLDTANRFSSKDELVAFSNDAVARAKNKIPAYFGLLPAATLEIKPMPDYQRSGFSHYNSAPDDGSRPAAYYIQLYQFNRQDKGSVEKTAFHEAYPGHHLQISISRELIQSYPIVKYISNSGYTEGWARYTETLSDEMGLYTSERNRLSAYAGVPTGMVVDPGIHLKGWTREQAIAYSLEQQTSMTREMAESYIDRIAIWPGQMTTYGVGEMLFWKLRKKAQAAMGKQFDIRSFHDKCLELGTIPLNMLEQHVLDWIKKTSANKSIAIIAAGR